METLVANLAGKTRRERWLGRDYLVAPLTLIVPGVMSGSKGPLYYPPDEVAREPDSWNHVPIVVYHPTSNGSPTTARRPDVLERQGVGYVFNAGFKGKLRAEGWFDIERTKAVDPRVLTALEAGNPFELSTGLYTDNEPAPGGSVFNGASGPRPYTYIARNYRPDHLAVLPDRKGACSVADGCGVLVNESDMFGYELAINEAEEQAASLYFPDLNLLTANAFDPNQPRDSSGKWATVAEAKKAVGEAQGRVSKAQAALEKAKAALKLEKDGLLVAKKGLEEAKGREKARSPAAQKAIEKAKAGGVDAHATGKRLQELAGTLAARVGRQGNNAADLQARGRAEVEKSLAGIKSKVHAAALAEGFGIKPAKTVKETKAAIARHVEARIGSSARVKLVDRPDKPTILDTYIEKTKGLFAEALHVDPTKVKAHVDQMAKDLNKDQVLQVAKSVDLHGLKTKKDALKNIHDTIVSQNSSKANPQAGQKADDATAGPKGASGRAPAYTRKQGKDLPNEPAVRKSLPVAVAEATAKNRSGFPTIADLYDSLKDKHPDLTLPGFHKQLLSWSAKDHVTLLENNDPRFLTPRELSHSLDVEDHVRSTTRMRLYSWMHPTLRLPK